MRHGGCTGNTWKCRRIRGREAGDARDIPRVGEGRLRGFRRSKGNPEKLHSTGARSGKLTAAEREKMAGYLKEADLPGLGSGVMELAGGSGTEDGWAGSINFVQPDKKTVIRYESHGGWPTDPKAQEM